MTDIMMSENIGELAKALAAAQRVMEHAKKTKTNPFHKNKYADLTDVWDVLKKPLSDNGLSVVQLPATEGPYLILTTILMHSSGQWVSSVFKIKAKAETAQEMGSTLTYARRYTLAAITGNSSNEDDDGNSASGVYDREPRQKAQAQVIAPITPPARSQIPEEKTPYINPMSLQTVTLPAHTTEGEKHFNPKVDPRLNTVTADPRLSAVNTYEQVYYSASDEQKKKLAALCERFGITEKSAWAEISGKLMGMPMEQIEDAIVELSK